MKYIIALLFILMVGTITTKAQGKNDVVIAVEGRTNILYKGIPNPISFSNEKSKDITISCSNKAIAAKDAKGHWNIWVDDCKYRDTVIVTIFVKGKKKESKHFIVRYLPMPRPYFGNLTDEKISLTDILAQNKITAKLDSHYKIDTLGMYTVIKYTLMFYSKSKSNKDSLANAKVFFITGPNISESIKAYIRTLKSGDVIQLSSVVVMGPGKIGMVNLTDGIRVSIE